MNPTNLRYTDQHEWVKVEGSTVVVGITEYAQKALGDMTFVDLPKVGKSLAKGDEAVAVESCKAAASVYSPVSGKVLDVNSALSDDPSAVNADPYGAGWMVKISFDNPADLDTLMDAAAYDAFSGKEQ